MKFCIQRRQLRCLQLTVMGWVCAQRRAQPHTDAVWMHAGTKREKYLAENIAAFEVSQRLTQEDLAEIEAAFPHAEVAGERC